MAGIVGMLLLRFPVFGRPAKSPALRSKHPPYPLHPHPLKLIESWLPEPPPCRPRMGPGLHQLVSAGDLIAVFPQPVADSERVGGI